MSKQLECPVELHGNAVLIRPIGRLDSARIPRFEQIVMPHVQAARHDVVLDFSELTFLSSSVLRILLLAARAAKRHDKAFLLCALRPHITDLMNTAGFNRLLTIHATREEAMRIATNARGDNAPPAEPASPAPAEPATNADEIPEEPAATPAPGSTDIADRGLFQPTWATLRWHLCLDAAIAAAGVAGAWAFYELPPAWENLGVTFLVLAVPTALVSFGPPRVRRFFNRLLG